MTFRSAAKRKHRYMASFNYSNLLSNNINKTDDRDLYNKFIKKSHYIYYISIYVKYHLLFICH